ncbi:hypothetical protein TNCV_2024481 [Trichonephila clavipes]|nr:hypothetical protein TNCV_2024481 [Trichonephila clavipes]
MGSKTDYPEGTKEKESRHFHRNIEDTVTGDCSEEDEALMDCQSGPSTSNSGAGAIPIAVATEQWWVLSRSRTSSESPRHFKIG